MFEVTNFKPGYTSQGAIFKCKETQMRLKSNSKSDGIKVYSSHKAIAQCIKCHTGYFHDILTFNTHKKTSFLNQKSNNLRKFTFLNELFL